MKIPICYLLSHSFSWAQQLKYFIPFVPNREISDMILLIRSNISLNDKNQYY